MHNVAACEWNITSWKFIYLTIEMYCNITDLRQCPLVLGNERNFARLHAPMSEMSRISDRWNWIWVQQASKCLLGPAAPYLADLCRPVVHLTGRRHLWSAASGKLDVPRTSTAIGRRNFTISGPETWNSLPAELRLSTLSTATFARRLKAHLFVSTEGHVPAARLILLKAALFINIIIIIIDVNGPFIMLVTNAPTVTSAETVTSAVHVWMDFSAA